MSGFRAVSGGLIDRSGTLSFTFDGRSFTGHPGDTVVSALLANGERILGRSFKYHRPRGAWSSWFDDPNAIFNISLNGSERPNCQGATTMLEDGMEVRAVNAYPNARSDLKGGLDLFHRFLSAGFYYKMFMWPDWHLFEPSIRKMAGLGALDFREIEEFESPQTYAQCDVLVIGGGPAGLVAARKAAEAGQKAVLVEDHSVVGGSAFQCNEIEGAPPSEWIKAQLDAIGAAGGELLTGATAFGVYDHQMIGIAQDRGFLRAPGLIRMRAGRAILATGALDRPLTFARNDLPGIMSLKGAADLVARYGVVPGQRIAVMACHTHADTAIRSLEEAGAAVERLAPDAQAIARGGRYLNRLDLPEREVGCDTILTSAGLMPVVHLWRHAGGKLAWDEKASAFLPSEGPDWISVIGGANGTFDLEAALAEARGDAGAASTYRCDVPDPVLGSKQRQWIDFQHDVTLKDVELAARENFISVEHLKRYTTLGMASDQGKTSNVAGLSAMAALTGRSIPETGTTTFRPPFVPIPFELYRGAHRQQQIHPLKRLPLEAAHRQAGAALCEYGGWLRPGWYGGDKDAAIPSEALMVRNAAGLLDASPLGKIEVMGPDAAAFVNFIYYNTIRTLKPGHIRYGFMLTEGGIVYDDGVITRMDDNRFIISCSSSHVDGVASMLEAWRQDGNDPDRIFVHDTTENWPTVTVTGPKARDIVAGLDLGIDLSPEAFPHMQFRLGTWQGAEARVARVSFTGEVSYEISVQVDQVQALWARLVALGEPLGAAPVGIEAISILRAEKGYIIIGKDTDGSTMPHDLGFGIPRQKKITAFVGDRSLHTQEANREDRLTLVGLEVAEGARRLPDGAHVVSEAGEAKKSVGFVTSSYLSPTLNRPIALALVNANVAVNGEVVALYHLGRRLTATVTAPCFFDPEGERLNA